MLDKQRDTIIKQAFRKAKITSPETDPTEAEIEDAVFSLNAMLASWNNDGFRLFKMKTGFMPLIPKVADYKLSEQAYSSFEKAQVASFNTIGATKIKVGATAGIDVGQSLVVTNNTTSETNFVDAIDGDVLTLRYPLNIACSVGDTVTCGATTTTLVADAPLAVREVVTATPLLSAPATIAVKSSDSLGQVLTVEKQLDSYTLVVSEPINESVLEAYGKIYLYADKTYAQEDIVTQDEFTGNILSFGVGDDGQYIEVLNEGTKVLYFKANGADSWAAVVTSTVGIGSNFRLKTVGSNVYVMDADIGLFSIKNGVAAQLFLNHGVEDIIEFKNKWYLFSPTDDESLLRQLTNTSDFVTFNAMEPVFVESLKNPVEFAGRLFIGSTSTAVTSNMVEFSVVPVYSENRCVVGNKMMNINSTQLCSYTDDGVEFKQVPFRISDESHWGYKDGCSFIAIYNPAVELQPDCSQIFLTNKFEPDWNNQMVVQGLVFDIIFANDRAYFVSPEEVKSLVLVQDYNSEDYETDLFLYGDPIGRPQEIMNVVKYSLYGFVELPMDAVSLKDFTKLPKISADGEPVSYCFFRDTNYGKMLVWGTPTKLGEYLKFTYVEPMTLLEESTTTPDFPDEYVEAVIDGLAVQLGHEYGVPEGKMELLIATAAESKSLAELHDNEDTSYQITPNQRIL